MIPSGTIEKNQIRIVVGVSAFFAAIAVYSFKFGDFMPFWLAGVIIMAYLTITEAKSLWYIAIFGMPLSMSITGLIGSSAQTIPSDFSAIGILGILLAKTLQGFPMNRRMLQHPITIMLIIYLTWMLFTSFFAEDGIIAFKYFAATLWFIVGFYVFSLIIFKKTMEIERFYWLSSFSLLFVLLTTLIDHAGYNFSHESSYNVMQPFYKEHTAYGASITMFFPGIFLLWLKGNYKKKEKYYLLLFLAVLLFAIITSYTRGAWLGLMAAMGLLSFLYLPGKLRKYIVPALLVGGILYLGFNYEALFKKAEDQFSTENELTKRVTSFTDLKHDDANKERINRWVAAFNMVQERPFTGFGPGNYVTEYAPYQDRAYKTEITTMRGDNGSAHSEFFLAGAEMGIPGSLIIIILFFVVLLRGVKGFYQLTDPKHKMLMAGALAGLVSYMVHGLVNNFLDQDKIAIPAYCMMAIITVLDVLHNPIYIKKYRKRWIKLQPM